MSLVLTGETRRGARGVEENNEGLISGPEMGRVGRVGVGEFSKVWTLSRRNSSFVWLMELEDGSWFYYYCRSRGREWNNRHVDLLQLTVYTE